MGWAFILFLTSHIYTMKFDSRAECTSARDLLAAYPVSSCFQLRETASGERIPSLAIRLERNDQYRRA